MIVQARREANYAQSQEGRDPNDEEGRLEKFGERLERAIDYFGGRKERLDNLVVELTSLQETEPFEQVFRLRSIGDRYSEVNNIDSLVDYSSQNQARLDVWASTYRERGEDLGNVISELDKIDVSNKARDRRRLEANVLIINHSSSDNEILDRAMLKVRDTRNNRKEGFRLELQHRDGYLEGRSMSRLSFQSHRDAADSRFIREIAADQLEDSSHLRCQVAGHDMHGRLWMSTEVQCAAKYEWKPLEGALARLPQLGTEFVQVIDFW